MLYNSQKDSLYELLYDMSHDIYSIFVGKCNKLIVISPKCYRNVTEKHFIPVSLASLKKFTDEDTRPKIDEISIVWKAAAAAFAKLLMDDSLKFDIGMTLTFKPARVTAPLLSDTSTNIGRIESLRNPVGNNTRTSLSKLGPPRKQSLFLEFL